MTTIAEFLLVCAFNLAGFNQRGDNVRWSVYQYFRRFRDAPVLEADRGLRRYQMTRFPVTCVEREQ